MKKKFIKIILVLIAIGLLYILVPTANALIGKKISWSQFENRPAVNSDDIGTLINAAEELWNKTEQVHLSGYVLIQQNGTTLFEKGTPPETSSSPMYVGSFSKQFTGAKVLELIAEKKLAMEDTACKYLPGFCRDDLKSITISHLLSHTSGLPVVSGGTRGQLALVVAEQPLDKQLDVEKIKVERPPGKKYLYSNLGFLILSRIIEKVTGQSYSEVMADFFKRHHLDNTFSRSGPSPVTFRVHQNTRFLGGPILASKVRPDYDTFVYANAFGTGSVASTVTDVTKWLRDMLNSGRAKKLLETIPAKKDAIEMRPNLGEYYFAGWIIDTKHRLVWHNGQIAYFRTEAIMNVNNGLTAVAIFNQAISAKDEETVRDSWEDLLTAREYKLPK